VLVACATILISTYIPARRASNISAIDAIRQVTDVKIKGRQVRTFRLTRRIFGIEGDLGLKNLKRNKGRYKATVFSLIISMILFLVVSTFTDYLRKSLEMTQDGISFDIWTSIGSKDDKEREGILKEISALDHIDEMRVIRVLQASTQIEEQKVAEFVKDNKDAIRTDGKYNYDITVNVMEDDALKEYAKEIGADYDKLEDSTQPSAIVIDTMRFKDNDADKYVETKLIKTKVNDSFVLGVPDGKSEKSIALQPFKVAALTDKLPMGIMSLGNTAGFHIIMSESAFDSMVKDQQELAHSLLNTNVYFNSDNPVQLQTELEKVQSEVGVSKLELFNVYNYKDKEQQALILVSVFTYAFIILITIICIANIINTISTSIALRKREFAMLKSIGITPNGFNRMLNFESIFYGIKAIIYGLPISFLAMYLMYHALSIKFDYGFIFPIDSICIVIASVFLIVGTECSIPAGG
jgi:putative ABC transport system permease protein